MFLAGSKDYAKGSLWMKQLQMMPTLARTFAKTLPTVLGSRTTRWMALACCWRIVNALTLSVTLTSVVGKIAHLKMQVKDSYALRLIGQLFSH